MVGIVVKAVIVKMAQYVIPVMVIVDAHQDILASRYY